MPVRGGYCVEGILPPLECVQWVQRYQVRAGDAFALVGEDTGFLHNRIVDADTGECVDRPEPSPFNVGRVPLRAPECTDDPATGPNPCSTVVSHVETYVPFEVAAGTCVPQDFATRSREMWPQSEFRIRS